VAPAGVGGCQCGLCNMRISHYSQSEARSEQFEDRSEPANEKHMCFTRLAGSSQLICLAHTLHPLCVYPSLPFKSETNWLLSLRQ